MIDKVKPTPGVVYLVGAGPGDPGLITVRGAQLLAAAQVVVYDRLASEQLLELASPEAELISVGKAPGQQGYSQEEINALLVSRAKQGKIVVRLKGGDPFVFGRGGEEGSYLREHDVPFVVVPGVTSAVAGPAYAGIPVTDRRCASSFAVMTGRPAADKTLCPDGPAGWAKRAWAADTLVFLMAMGELDNILEGLLLGGRSSDTPAALIERATTPQQRVLVSTLGELATTARDAVFSPPAVLVVGEVVRLRESLIWFEPYIATVQAE